MRLTRVHVAFWLARRRPSWAARVERPETPPTIHACVNDHAGVKPDARDKSFATQTMVVLTRNVRDRPTVHGDLRMWLRAIAHTPGTVNRPEKRAALARKWLRRLNRGR